MSPRHRYYRETVWHKIPGWWYLVAGLIALGVFLAVVLSGGIGLDDNGAPDPAPTVTQTRVASPTATPTETIRATVTATASRTATMHATRTIPGPTTTVTKRESVPGPTKTVRVPGPTVTETTCNTVTYGNAPGTPPPPAC